MTITYVARSDQPGEAVPRDKTPCTPAEPADLMHTPCTRCGQVHRWCAAHRKSDGQPCNRRPKKGATVCHGCGGAARQVQEAAQRRREEEAAREAVAKALADRHAIPLDVDPTGQILHLVRVTAGIAEWIWREQILRLAPEAVAWGITERRTKSTPDGTEITEVEKAELNVWWRQHSEVMDRCAKYCQIALTAGVAERQIRLAERQGELLADGITWLLRELGHDGDEQALHAAHRMLTCLDGGLVPGRDLA